MFEILPREVLICTIARLLEGVRHVAVGASSPMPAAGAMLLCALEERRGAPPVRISILNCVYFENRSFSSSGLRVSLTQRRSAMT